MTKIGQNRSISASREMLRKFFGQNPPDKRLIVNIITHFKRRREEKAIQKT